MSIYSNRGVPDNSNISKIFNSINLSMNKKKVKGLR